MINSIYKIPSSVFIHPSAQVIGKVKIDECSSIWPNTVIRGDLNEILIGKYVNIQDNSVLHVDSHSPLVIGDYTLVGHMAMLHGCRIGKACLIGIRTLILDEVEIGDGSMITANCIIRGKTKIPPYSLVIESKGEIKIYPNKAKPLTTILACLEYYELAKKHTNRDFTDLNEIQKKDMEIKAQLILKEIFSNTL